jgi:hypothetical protein
VRRVILDVIFMFFIYHSNNDETFKITIRFVIDHN